MADITQYGARGNGARACSFRIGQVQILVTPNDEEQNDEALELAERLADEGESLLRLARELEQARQECADLRGKIRVQEAPPTRLLGPGYVRFRGRHLWLLGSREKGWSAFGFRLDSWDELFRLYDVRVTEHGIDEHGAWWMVENNLALEASA